MAGKTGKSAHKEAETCGLTDRQYRELTGKLEKLLKNSSREIRDLSEQVRKEMDQAVSAMMTASEKQTLENLSALSSASASIERSESVSSDLTSQVASLRDYLARQQELVKRFQDGYDWTVIRNFCNRIIRCIDDVRRRMETGEDMTDSHRTDLELIHDQLVFALDGSGVEQFQPEPGTPYAGQEKIAEVVGKDSSEDGEPGCISKVVSPGYSFYVNEEQSRLVRPAKVRLFQRKSVPENTEGSDGVE